VTRDLNQTPADFAHEGSCWWGSYFSGRCMVKTNGGFGLRTYRDGPGTYPTGRAWVMPLRRESEKSFTLDPTFDSLTPDAFAVFNTYGDLANYTGARLMAHLAGMTYRKVDLYFDGIANLYINSGSGYLVGPEEICEHYQLGSGRVLQVRVQQHNNLFEREQAALINNNQKEKARV
jgi:hypothetical protein